VLQPYRSKPRWINRRDMLHDGTGEEVRFETILDALLPGSASSTAISRE
jgi:hypothetical protein